MRFTISLLLWALLAPVAQAQITLLGSGASGGGAVTPQAYYSFVNSFSTNANGNTATTTMNVGTATAARVIIISAAAGNGSSTLTSVTVNSIACSIDANVGGAGVASCPGLTYGSGNQTVVVTWSVSGFVNRGFSLWTAFFMTSTTAIHSVTGTSPPSSINVTARDFMFGAASCSNCGSGPTWSGSSETPTNTQIIFSGYAFSANWSIQSTRAAFSLNPSTSNLVSYAAATYR